MKKYLSLVLATLLIVGALAGCGGQRNTQAPATPGTSAGAKDTVVV